jgi:mRNA interferase RelE/StbE
VQNLDIKKLEGKENPTYRLRSGDYRIIYTIEKQIVTVLVIEIKHRREVYRD